MIRVTLQQVSVDIGILLPRKKRLTLDNSNVKFSHFNSLTCFYINRRTFSYTERQREELERERAGRFLIMIDPSAIAGNVVR